MNTPTPTPDKQLASVAKLKANNWTVVIWDVDSVKMRRRGHSSTQYAEVSEDGTVTYRHKRQTPQP